MIAVVYYRKDAGCEASNPSSLWNTAYNKTLINSDTHFYIRFW